MIHVPSGRSPQARMTSPKARLMVIANLPERMVRASRRETWRPAWMSKMARGSGDHQRIGSPSLNHGNTPSAYARSRHGGSRVPPTPTSPFSSANAGGIQGTSP